MRHAYMNRAVMADMFSSDRNFATWCRYDVNRSELDAATDDQGAYSPREAKDALIKMFLDSCMALAVDESDPSRAFGVKQRQPSGEPTLLYAAQQKQSKQI